MKGLICRCLQVWTIEHRLAGPIRGSLVRPGTRPHVDTAARSRFQGAQLLRIGCEISIAYVNFALCIVDHRNQRHIYHAELLRYVVNTRTMSDPPERGTG